MIRHNLQSKRMEGKVLDKVFVRFTRFNINDIFHELRLIHGFHKPIMVLKKVRKLIKNIDVLSKKRSKLFLQYFDLFKKGGKELPFFTSA